jgi:aminoglycoside 6-adenylyltransferase
MIELILKIAKVDERIRAVYMNGSRANPNIEKDKYQDYDIVFVVTETASFMANRDWLNKFGGVSYVFEGQWTQMQFGINLASIDFKRSYSWLMLLEDGNRVDLVIEIKEDAIKNFSKNKLTVLLLDKDGFLPEIAPPTDDDYHVKEPNADIYRACCNAFWWFLNDVAKGISRDEISFAIGSFNTYVRITLNQMIDWYIGIQTQFSVSTGKMGKHYRKYLPKELYDLYIETYSDGIRINIWNSIYSSCDLFKLTASYVGNYFGYIYNSMEETFMLNHLEKMKNGTL